MREYTTKIADKVEANLKKMLFQTVDQNLSLKEFEAWLYQQEALSHQMNDALILTLFEFNYNQRGAKYSFKNAVMKFLDHEEFMLWKIKTNLQDLIDGKESCDRILNEFYYFSRGELPFLHDLGNYGLQLEEWEYYNFSRNAILADVKKEATSLLKEIEDAQKIDPAFRIQNFERKIRPEIANTKIAPKKWWMFWKWIEMKSV